MNTPENSENEKQETIPFAENSGTYPTAPDAESEIRRLSRRSFLWGAVAIAGGTGGWKWLTTRPEEDGIGWPFRRALETNERLARDYFRSGRLAPTFPRAMARAPRANGDVGLDGDPDAENWQLRVQGVAQIPAGAKTEDNPAGQILLLTLADIQKFAAVEMVTELKCIEGWSEIVHWKGARLADLIAAYPPATHSGNPPAVNARPEDLSEYVSLRTPDEAYYVGLEMASALHPQTLLAYEMNGEPLTVEHGAPLRLVIPVKYGIKNIKRIGTIEYTAKKPADYWAERGYDWYAGH